MRLLAAVAVMSVMLVLGAEASECLDRSASQITVVPPGTYTTRFREDAPADFHTFDMRGAEWRMDVRPDGKPVGVYQHLKGACISGAAVVGMQPRDVSWDDVKNSDGPRFVYESGATVGHMTLEGVYVDNVGDGFEPARYSNSAGLGYSWSLRSSYFRWIRDDVIENDACHAGEVVDVLVDESFTFISTRPGSGNDLNTGAMPPVIKVHDTLVHIGSLPGGAGRLWKWPGSSSSCTPEPILDVRNSIFRVDVEAGTMDFPEGTYQNVTVVWTGDGSFPVVVPSGVTVTTDIGSWDAARSDWLERHGCDENGDFCDGLLEPVDDPTPDPGPEPDPESEPDPEPEPAVEIISMVASLDTHLRQASPSTSYGARTTINVDSSDRRGQVQGLLWFDLSQIPPGSTVQSASLTLRTRGSGAGARFHTMLRAWNESSTWASLSGGISADDIEASSVEDFSTGFMSSGSRTFDVAAAIQDWVDGTPNHGWALLPLGSNGWDLYSRQGSAPPVLTVTFERLES